MKNSISQNMAMRIKKYSELITSFNADVQLEQELSNYFENGPDLSDSIFKDVLNHTDELGK